MTPEQAKELLPIMEAFANRKKIQTRSIYHRGEWKDCEIFYACANSSEYRIKPEPPKPREWWVCEANGAGFFAGVLSSLVSKEVATDIANRNGGTVIKLREVLE